MRLPRHRPQAITSLIEPPDIKPAAAERLTAPIRGRGWLSWACGLALLLHVLVIAAALFLKAKPLPEDEAAAQSVSVTLDNGAAPQNAAPPAPQQGPPQPAQRPAAPPPPPPPPQPPEVNLSVPENLLAALPPPPPHPQPHARPRPHPVPQHHYVMMLNGMSYGSSSASPPAPAAHKSLNMELAESDAQAVMGPELTVKGNVGADWMSTLSDWVNKHAIYPSAAEEQNQQGTAEVIFNVDRNGHVTGLHLVNSAGSPFLDQAWEDLFRNNQLPRFPPDAKDNHATVDYTVHYQLVGP